MTNTDQILRTSLDKIAAKLSYNNPKFKITQVSTEGANFSSYLFEATISTEGRDDVNLFAKVAASGEKMRAMVGQFYITENIFYTELLPEYRKLEEKHGVGEKDRLKAPEVYDCSPILYEETVVMENLSTKGYTLHDRIVSVDWNYAATSFTELAKFHALSLALKHEHPDRFENFSKVFTFPLTAMGSEIEAQMKVAVREIVEKIKEENKGKLVAFLSKDFGLQTFIKYFAPGEDPVIRHGDFRPSNLLSKTNEDGSVDLVPVDYQTLICGSPVIDVFYFIFLGTDKQFREEHFERLLDHYYSQLSSAITRLGMDPEEKYSRKKFDDEVKENLPYGLCAALSTLALVTVDSADAPKLTNDLDFATFQTLKTNDVFTERINGVVDDFVRWGIL